MNNFKTMLMSVVMTACPLHSNQFININVPYYGIDKQRHVGTLVVNKDVASEVQKIFNTLDNTKFPIAKIRPLSNYPTEEAAMLDNDTFALSCRLITNSNKLSNHSFGIAIDINPVFNPYVKGKVVIPANGLHYINRNITFPGMIIKNDVVVQTFAHFGWRWGGNWKSLKDYQHFEKHVTPT